MHISLYSKILKIVQFVKGVWLILNLVVAGSVETVYSQTFKEPIPVNHVEIITLLPVVVSPSSSCFTEDVR